MQYHVIHTLAADEGAPSLVSLFADIPLASKIAVLLGFLAPAVSAYLTRKPSFVTGVLTAVVSALVAFVATWAAQGTTFDLGTALATAFGTLAIAWGAQAKLYRDTPQVQWLHNHGLLYGVDFDTNQLTDDIDPNWADEPEDDDLVPAGVDPDAENPDPGPYADGSEHVIPDDGSEYDAKHDVEDEPDVAPTTASGDGSRPV